MLRSALLSVCLACASLRADSLLWQNVSPTPARLTTDAPTATPNQIQQIKSLLSIHSLMQIWDCKSVDPDGDWLQNLSFIPVILAPHQSTFLVEAGPGCARGGQGANGAMWIVRFTAGHPQLLAAPDLGFGGWLFQIPATTSHGYRDIILAWHTSYDSANLSYFRFDGRQYRQISFATATFNRNGQATITPSELSNHKRVTSIP